MSKILIYDKPEEFLEAITQLQTEYNKKVENQPILELVTMNKPARLHKPEPITIQLNPAIIMAGVILMVIILSIGLGFNESYNYLISGV